VSTYERLSRLLEASTDVNAIPSVVENNVDIAVASLPALVTFVRVHVGQNSSIQKLRSKFSGNSAGKWFGASSVAWTPPANAAFGSARKNGHYNDYHELDDSVLLQTQVTIANDKLPFTKHTRGAEEGGIMRTAVISPHTEPWHQHPQAQ
jgi:hypothetical protein